VTVIEIGTNLASAIVACAVAASIIGIAWADRKRR
jgi:hypothetical protein